MSDNLDRLAKQFGFHMNAFTLPPKENPDTENGLLLWRRWVTKMEVAFNAEHHAKPVYPNFEHTPYREILSYGVTELERLLAVHGRNFLSVIGGTTWKGMRGKLVTSHRPINKSVVAHSWGCHEGSEAEQQLHDALKDGLAESQSGWGSHEMWPDRVRMLMIASRLALMRLPINVAAMVTEVGMSPREAYGEYDEVIDFIRGYAIEATKIYLDQWFQPPTWKGEIHGHRSSAHGVLVSLAPFNFPAAIGVSMMFSALVMGNAVFHCPSEKTIVCGYLDYVLARDAIVMIRKDLDLRNVVHFAISHRGDTVRALLAMPEVTAISFTGSSDVFAFLMREYGSLPRANGSNSLIIGAAETSGVNPVYVCFDADVSKAAKELPGSFLGRSGHKCSSSRNIMVHDSIYDRFKTEFFQAIDALSYGEVMKGAYFGPVVSSEMCEELWVKINTLVDAGDVTIAYQKKITATGGFDMPAVVLEATPSALGDPERLKRIRNTEIFGPVTCLVRVTSPDEAITIANMSEYALTAAVYTQSEDIATKWSSTVRTGNSNVNMPPTGALAVSQWFGAPPSRSGANWGAKGPDLLRRLRSEKAISVKVPVHLNTKEKAAWFAAYRRIMTCSKNVG
jgi:acyl-CoA reductase-like NAD-dependent aldehyde dehydrogenase